MMAGAIKKASSLMSSLSYLTHPFLSPNHVSKVQFAGLITKALRDKDYKRFPAYPYQEKDFTWLAMYFDRTMLRIEDNSKLIVVEGPVASGKDKLAKEIAKQYDMHYISHANLDYLYINSYGYDFRDYMHTLPKHLQVLSVKEFLENPKERRAALLQNRLFIIRFKQYIDALNHILNTGQGVVMDRCVFSNQVFVDAYVKAGFLPKTYPKYHYQVWNCLKREIMRPHLVIYLDTPVDVIRKNLKKRNNPVEINSPVNQPETLKMIEDNYKFKYLQEISTHAELLVYDNSEEVEADIVVEDMEKVNLDDFHVYDPKMKDWRFVDEFHWSSKRISLSRDREELEAWLFNIPPYDCDELVEEVHEIDQFMRVYNSVPGNGSPKGFNTELGDSCFFRT